MNPTPDRRLEAALERELRALPELNAPDMLAARILSAVARQARLPWYRQPWQTWPTVLQTGSLALLLGMFGALCYGGWRFSQMDSVAVAFHELAGWLACFGVVWDLVRVLAQTVVVVAEKLGPGFIAACLLAAAFSYLACVGIGTLVVRYAFARRITDL